MHKFIITCACATFVLALSPSLTSAQFQVGGHLGLDFERSDIYVGPHVVFDLPVEISGDDYLKLSPEFSYYLADSDVEGVSSSFWLLGATALYPLGFEFATTYFGAGLLIARASSSVEVGTTPDVVSESATDVGLILKAGAEFGREGAKPFGEGGFVLSDGSWVFLQGGVRFGFGSD